MNDIISKYALAASIQTAKKQFPGLFDAGTELTTGAMYEMPEEGQAEGAPVVNPTPPAAKKRGRPKKVVAACGEMAEEVQGRVAATTEPTTTGGNVDLSEEGQPPGPSVVNPTPTRRKGRAKKEADAAERSLPGKGLHAHAASASPSSVRAIIDELREQHTRRRAWHRNEKSLTLTIKAMCRRYVDGDLKEATALYNAIGTDKHRLGLAVYAAVYPLLDARAGLEAQRKIVEKRRNTIAAQLPVAPFVDTVPGFGIGSLADVIGEAGDLSRFSRYCMLWKYMGLAVFGGQRQRRIKGDAEAAKEQGYSPQRRSVMYIIGTNLLKAQSARIDAETGEVLRPAGPYRVLYDERKAYELTKITKEDEFFLAHKRAQRYIEKRLLRELWKAWRDSAEV